jgi:hypothetical protein
VTCTFPTSGAITNDFQARTGEVTFQSGETNVSVVFTPADDNYIETNELVRALLSLPVVSGGVPQLATSNLVITLVESKVGLTFTNNSVLEVNGGATNSVTLMLTRSGNTNLTSTFDWVTSNGTAIATGDYITASGTITMDPGVITTNVTVEILGDDLVESNETLTVVLSNLSTGSVVLANGLITILDNDATIQFQLATNSVLERSNLLVRVVRSGPTTDAVAVYYTTVDGSAVATNDYVGTSGVLTFAPGVRTNTLSIALVDDGVLETNETVLLVLTNTSAGAALGTVLTNTVTIVDDDSIIYMVSTNLSVSEGVGTANVSVRRIGYTNVAASVTFITSNGTAVSGSDYTFTNSTLTFAAGATNGTIAVRIVNDYVMESLLESFRVVLIGTSTNAAISNAVCVVGITDNDFAFGDMPVPRAVPRAQSASSGSQPGVVAVAVDGPALVVRVVDLGVSALLAGVPEDLAEVRVSGGKVQLVTLWPEGEGTLALECQGADLDADGVPDAIAAALGEVKLEDVLLLTIRRMDGTLLSVTPFVDLLKVEGAPQMALPATWRLVPAPK